MDNYLNKFFEIADIDSIKQIIKQREEWKKRKSTQKYYNLLNNVKHIKTSYFDFSSDIVSIGKEEELTQNDKKILLETLIGFKPWRKGPFNIFGNLIDAEWRSEKKFNRIIPYLPDLKGKVICDVGCNNGYYMFRLYDKQPSFILGIDPTLHYYFTYKLLSGFIELKNIAYELLGVEHIKFFTESFDVVLLMGILYHHPSPLDILKNVFKSLKKNGILIIESQGIPGEGSFALFPAKRYAKAPGVYFLPTVGCLYNFVKRAGFRNIEVFYIHKMTPKEQRRTKWMDYESFIDFLDPDNPELTVEGYPAPIRIYIKCQK